jgi:hypothetical protein
MGQNGPEEGGDSGEWTTQDQVLAVDTRRSQGGLCGSWWACGERWARSGSPGAPFIGPRIAQRPAFLVSDPSMDLSAPAQHLLCTCVWLTASCSPTLHTATDCPFGHPWPSARFCFPIPDRPSSSAVALAASDAACALACAPASTARAGDTWLTPAPSLRDTCHSLTDLMLSHRARALPPFFAFGLAQLASPCSLLLARFLLASHASLHAGLAGLARASDGEALSYSVNNTPAARVYGLHHPNQCPRGLE